MLILDGRIPQERVPNVRAAERLARESFAYWRGTSSRTARRARKRGAGVSGK
jgi:hypothetical protein